MPVQFRVYIVRHGETEWNRLRRIQGQLDTPLNETGLKQAMLVAEALKDVPFVRAFSSDLQRATKTTECILRHHPDVVLERDELIRERYMGELQGEKAPLNKSAPSMETASIFTARCLVWYSRTIVEYLTSTLEAGILTPQTRNILVVSHGAWITALLSALLAHEVVTRPQGVQIGHCLNTGVSVIEYRVVHIGEDEALMGTLVQYSDVKHLIREDLHLQKENADIRG